MAPSAAVDMTSDAHHIRIALVEDDVHFQQGLCDAIRGAPDLQISTVAISCAQGLEMLHGDPADVLLVDIGLPDGSGVDVISAARTHWPDCGIMVYTVFGDELHVMQALEAGAAGYLLKGSQPSSIVAEIRSLHAGGSPISPLIARQVLMRLLPRGHLSAHLESVESPPFRAALSNREQQVLEYITKGFNAEEIAGLMAVTRHTVQTFVRRIYKKLEVNSKAEAIFEARQQGLLER